MIPIIWTETDFTPETRASLLAGVREMRQQLYQVGIPSQLRKSGPTYTLTFPNPSAGDLARLYPLAVKINEAIARSAKTEQTFRQATQLGGEELSEFVAQAFGRAPPRKKLGQIWVKNGSVTPIRGYLDPWPTCALVSTRRPRSSSPSLGNPYTSIWCWNAIVAIYPSEEGDDGPATAAALAKAHAGLGTVTTAIPIPVTPSWSARDLYQFQVALAHDLECRVRGHLLAAGVTHANLIRFDLWEHRSRPVGPIVSVSQLELPPWLI